MALHHLYSDIISTIIFYESWVQNFWYCIFKLDPHLALFTQQGNKGKALWTTNKWRVINQTNIWLRWWDLLDPPCTHNGPHPYCSLNTRKTHLQYKSSRYVVILVFNEQYDTHGLFIRVYCTHSILSKLNY